MRVGQYINLKGEECTIIKEYRDFFLIITKGFSFKQLPKFTVIK